MNTYLKEFLIKKFEKPGRALDLGAGDLVDVEDMSAMGWYCVGVDKKTGIDLNELHIIDNGNFDLVISNYVLHLMKNKQQLFDNAYSNLRHGGYLFLHVLHKDDINTKSGSSENDVLRMLSMFKVISKKTIDIFDKSHGDPHWHKIIEVVAEK